MSGHSKWHSIKHKKGAADAGPGQALRHAHPPDRGRGPRRRRRHRRRTRRCARWCRRRATTRCRSTRSSGRSSGGPASKRACVYEPVAYEGYAPSGVAVLVEVLTDNRNRTGSEIKNVFTPQRRVARGARRGRVAVRAQGRDARRRGGGRRRTTSCSPRSMPVPRTSSTKATAWPDHDGADRAPCGAHRDRGSRDHRAVDADLTMLPTTSVALDRRGQRPQSVLRLIDALEDHDDVQGVYANFDIPDAVLEAVIA